MDCEPQLSTSDKKETSDILKRFKKLNQAWYINIETDPAKPKNWKPFGDLECMIIQYIYELYMESDHDQKYQLANTGTLTIDLKAMKMFGTHNPEDTSYHLNVKQGQDHVRPSRPGGNERFSAALITPSERDGAQGFTGVNFLGK